MPEDLTEEDIYQLVWDALGENIIEKEEKKFPGTIKRKQEMSIGYLLYTKLRKKRKAWNLYKWLPWIKRINNSFLFIS